MIDGYLYKKRSYVEIFFQKIKRFRRFATRDERLAVTFSGLVLLASNLVWLHLPDCGRPLVLFGHGHNARVGEAAHGSLGVSEGLYLCR